MDKWCFKLILGLKVIRNSKLLDKEYQKNQENQLRIIRIIIDLFKEII